MLSSPCLLHRLPVISSSTVGALLDRNLPRANVPDDYSVLLYQGLGQTGGVPLILGAAYCTIAAFLNYVCALLIDRVGRVRLMSKSMDVMGYLLLTHFSHRSRGLRSLSLSRVSSSCRICRNGEQSRFERRRIHPLLLYPFVRPLTPPSAGDSSNG